MHGKSIISNWSIALEKKLFRSGKEIIAKGLSAYDFPTTPVTIMFADESSCIFNFAFALINAEKKIAAVFTEHCGYYEFPIAGAIVREGTADIYIDEYYEE
jgi:hypothetical protein